MDLIPHHQLTCHISFKKTQQPYASHILLSYYKNSVLKYIVGEIIAHNCGSYLERRMAIAPSIFKQLKNYTFFLHIIEG